MKLTQLWDVGILKHKLTSRNYDKNKEKIKLQNYEKFILWQSIMKSNNDTKLGIMR